MSSEKDSQVNVLQYWLDAKLSYVVLEYTKKLACQKRDEEMFGFESGKALVQVQR